MINTAKDCTPLKLAKIIVTAQWREMTRSEWMGYQGAEEGTQVCDNHPDAPTAFMLLSPEGGEYEGALELHFADGSAASLRSEALIDPN